MASNDPPVTGLVASGETASSETRLVASNGMDLVSAAKASIFRVTGMVQEYWSDTTKAAVTADETRTGDLMTKVTEAREAYDKATKATQVVKDRLEESKLKVQENENTIEQLKIEYGKIKVKADEATQGAQTQQSAIEAVQARASTTFSPEQTPSVAKVQLVSAELNMAAARSRAAEQKKQTKVDKVEEVQAKLLKSESLSTSLGEEVDAIEFELQECQDTEKTRHKALQAATNAFHQQGVDVVGNQYVKRMRLNQATCDATTRTAQGVYEDALAKINNERDNEITKINAYLTIAMSDAQRKKVTDDNDANADIRQEYDKLRSKSENGGHQLFTEQNLTQLMAGWKRKITQIEDTGEEGAATGTSHQIENRDEEGAAANAPP